MDVRDELLAGLEEIANDEQLSRVLSTFRKRLNAILSAVFDEVESKVYLMVYDYGVTEGLYGPDSAVSVGIRKGVDDAVHISPIRLSSNLLGKAEELGRKHGVLMRSMIGHHAMPADSKIEAS
ncbi:hypothetical protein DIE03_32490 [Burkholderia sp. Bp8992]|uniref:hypothetical protein n=1 Tax=Burkholderia sp. Bp8992 TaxID=2184554 RepID=UPI000F56886D|nr:hypothetical protein [Burkholderia sp. Bp8992]RQS20573.1 hypothetical protein DIE03_32490 [Burkholderia sp. Bp8992]